MRRPDLRGLYNRSAQIHGMERNPVIVIPGTLGSKLVQSETEKVVWGAFGGGAANPQKPDGARLVALPMREGAALHELSDDVYPAGVLDRVKVKLFGMPLKLFIGWRCARTFLSRQVTPHRSAAALGVPGLCSAAPAALCVE